MNLIGLVVGGIAGRARRLLGRQGRPDHHARPRRADRVSRRSCSRWPSRRASGRARSNTIFALAFFSVAGVRTHLARGDAAAARADVHDRRAAVAARRRGARCCATSRRTSSPGSITFALLGMGIIIILEGALSFLGLGVPPPDPSWGNMISNGQQTLLGDAAVRAAAERVPVRDRPGVQPARRRAALALERRDEPAAAGRSDLRRAASSARRGARPSQARRGAELRAATRAGRSRSSASPARGRR